MHRRASETLPSTTPRGRPPKARDTPSMRTRLDQRLDRAVTSWRPPSPAPSMPPPRLVASTSSRSSRGSSKRGAWRVTRRARAHLRHQPAQLGEELLEASKRAVHAARLLQNPDPCRRCGTPASPRPIGPSIRGGSVPPSRARWASASDNPYTGRSVRTLAHAEGPPVEFGRSSLAVTNGARWLL